MIAHTDGSSLPDGVDILNQEPFVPGPDGENAYRLVWSLPAAVPDHLAGLDIRLVATQLPDGTFVTKSSDDNEAPTIYSGGDNFPVPDALAVAKAYTELAALSDKWTGRRSAVGIVTEARDVICRVQAALRELSTEAAGDDDRFSAICQAYGYMTSAVDACEDAIGALQ